MWEQQIDEIKQGNTKTLARCISYIENEVAGYEEPVATAPSIANAYYWYYRPSGRWKKHTWLTH